MKIKDSHNPAMHRGFLSLDSMGTLIVIALLVVTVLAAVAVMFIKNTVNTELTNVQMLVTESRGMLKTQGEYPFSSPAKMTGTLILFGGVPGNLTVNGDKTSGNAKLANSWGGEVLITPEKVQGSANNKGFSVTYKSVPMEACVTLATKLSGSAMINEISISGTNNTGAVNAEAAGTQCKSDNGSTGQNTLIFKSNN
ncbi:type 4 pilus major pilin [Morganella psychrotolerans]|uniref:type 4 pilus major pilin n=1 Tax=Morganella psychrotolerans TaxID=368603 RepID=UPI0039B076E4